MNDQKSRMAPHLTLKRKPETNEWVVQWVENGRVNDDKSYYTDDKQDAIGTMKDMQQRMDAMKAESLVDTLLSEASPDDRSLWGEEDEASAEADPDAEAFDKSVDKHRDVQRTDALWKRVKARQGEDEDEAPEGLPDVVNYYNVTLLTDKGSPVTSQIWASRVVAARFIVDAFKRGEASRGDKQAWDSPIIMAFIHVSDQTFRYNLPDDLEKLTREIGTEPQRGGSATVRR
jgi:hypothetical protein